MSDITPFPVLAHVVNIIKNAISDLKIQYTSTSTAILKDGNDGIYLEQRFDSRNFATVLINDQKDIIFSEDLLPVLENLHEGVKSELKSELQTATIVINDLDVETRLVLETAKDAFDQLSSSFEFIKTTGKELTKVKSEFKFENHCFEVTIINEPNQIFMEAEFSSTEDSVIKKVIETNTFKVQQALCDIFKKDKP